MFYAAISLPFSDAVTTFLQSIVNGIAEVIAVVKTLVESLVLFVKWFPQMLSFTNTTLIAFVPQVFVPVIGVVIVIFLIKLVLGSGSA